MYTLVETQSQFQQALKFISVDYEIIGLDIETTGLDYLSDKVLLIQVALRGENYIFDIRSLGYNNLKDLVSFLSTKKCILHNAKFDMKFLHRRTGIILQDVYCTLIAEAVLNAGRAGVGLSLRDLAYKYCGITMEKESRMDFVGLSDDSPITEQMLEYSSLDVSLLHEIYYKQLELANQAKELPIINMEMELVPIVMKMEYTGIRLDPTAWSKLESINKLNLDSLVFAYKKFLIDELIIKFSEAKVTGLSVAEKLMIPAKTKRLRLFLTELTDIENLRGWLYENFNVGSPHQMLAAIRLLGADIPNTNAKVILPFAEKHETIKRLLEVREVEKSVSTYGLSWLENIHPLTGRVHTEYFTGGTVTGRFSSSNPNMQNVPTHGGFRECFVPDDEYVFISCDYSQQEYRLAGAVSREPIIIEAYKNDFDMHTSTASNFYEKPMDSVTKDERSWGKTRNFEIIYGTTEWGLSKSLKSTVKYAKEVLDKYWAGYPTLFAFKTKVEEKILELGYSCTPMGRRRYNVEKPVFATPWELEMWKSRVKREGFNLIIQGGGADILKMAMINIAHKNPFGDKFRMLLQIHDELLFEVHKSIAKEAGELIMKEMLDAEQPFLGEIPAKVEGYDEIKLQWSK